MKPYFKMFARILLDEVMLRRPLGDLHAHDVAVERDHDLGVVRSREPAADDREIRQVKVSNLNK